MVDAVEERGGGRDEVGGVVQHVEPVSEHGPLDLDDVVGVERVLLRVGRAGGGASRSGRRRRPRAAVASWTASSRRPATTSAGRTTGWYAARSACVSRPPRPVTSRLISSASSPWWSTPGPSAAISSSEATRSGITIRPGRELALGVVEDGPALRVPAEDVVVGVVEVVARRRGQPVAAAGDLDRRRDDLAPRQPSVAPVGLARTPPASRAPRPSRGRWSCRRRRRTPSTTSHVEPGASVGARPRPGMSIHPSTVYAGRSPPGCTVTKPPELSETIPTSLTIATSAAARAASTALPPASATCSAASAAASFGAATARPDMPARYPPMSPWDDPVRTERGPRARVRSAASGSRSGTPRPAGSGRERPASARSRAARRRRTPRP